MVALKVSNKPVIGSKDGKARLRVVTTDGRAVYVSPFLNVLVASKFAAALARRRSLVRGVYVEHQNGGMWRPVRSYPGRATR
jgi:hypothetical protein